MAKYYIYLFLLKKLSQVAFASETRKRDARLKRTALRCCKPKPNRRYLSILENYIGNTLNCKRFAISEQLCSSNLVHFIKVLVIFIYIVHTDRDECLFIINLNKLNNILKYVLTILIQT